MAYSELIKNFERVRDYMRQFYVYGFKSRSEYDDKSGRSYDNERRRVESWLSEYMSFRQDAGGKNIFLSVDSRAIPHNPLYNAFKAKSFTDGDITFHFYILDILSECKQLTIREIVDGIAERYLSHFNSAESLDESSIRKKLKEYETLGLLTSCKQGRELVYSRCGSNVDLRSWRDAVSFFSEEAPLGVIGSFLLDKYDDLPDYFGYKHHYILHALDSEILCYIMQAIHERRVITLTIRSPRSGNKENEHTFYPYKVYASTQTGRQYVLGYHEQFKKPLFFRLDMIHKVELGSALSKEEFDSALIKDEFGAAVVKNEFGTALENDEFESAPHKDEKYGKWFEDFKENLWGVSTGPGLNLDHIEMTIHVGADERYIIDRLEREKRCGRVESLDEHTYKFVADVYDASEMRPWLRTFIGRIEKLECSNKNVTDTFFADLDAMNALYGGGADAVS
jgi:hypothetical protein